MLVLTPLGKVMGGWREQPPQPPPVVRSQSPWEDGGAGGEPLLAVSVTTWQGQHRHSTHTHSVIRHDARMWHLGISKCC